LASKSGNGAASKNQKKIQYLSYIAR